MMNTHAWNLLAGLAACAAGWGGGRLMWHQAGTAPVPAAGSAAAHAAPDFSETPPPAGPVNPASPADSPLGTLEEVLTKAEHATFDEACTLLQDSRRYTDTYRRRSTRDALLQRLVDLDPQRAMQFVQTYDEGRTKNVAMDIFTRSRPEEAMRHARSSRALWSQFSSSLAKMHPEKYFALLQPQEDGPGVVQSNSCLNDAFTALGMKNPQAALEKLNGLPESIRGHGKLRILKQWAIQDAGAALQWASADVLPEQRAMALSGIVYGTPSEETAVAAWKILREGDAPLETHSDVAKTVAKFIAERDPRQALDFIFGNLPAGPAGETVFETMLPALGPDNVQTVVELTGRLLAMGKGAPMTGEEAEDADETDPGALIRRSLGIWRPADTKAMLEGLPAEGGPPETAMVREYLAQRRAQEDPEGAVAWAQKAGPETRRAVAEQAMRTFIDRGDAAQCVAAAALLEPEEATRLLSAAGKGLARDHPQKAVAAAEAITDENSRAACLDSVSRVWAQRDPDAALEWALTRGGKEQASCLSAAVNSWASYDAWSASAWLAEQAPGPVRDSCIRGLVGSLAQSEPASAFVWAKSASSPQERESFMLWTAIRWAGTDPAAAMQTVNAESTLSAQGVEGFYSTLREKGIIP